MSHKNKPEVGVLHSSVGNRENGRKVDSWSFKSSLEGKETAIDFEVSLLANRSFVVKTNDIPTSRFEPLRGTDIGLLFEQAQDMARQEFDLNNNLIWSNWLEVVIKEGTSENSGKRIKNAGLNISYSIIPRGESQEGKVYTVGKNKTLIEFPENIGVDRQDDLISGFRTGERSVSADVAERLKDPTLSSSERMRLEMKGRDLRDAGSQFTYLPDTVENRLALESIIMSLEQLNQRLQVFLSPNQIQDTLSHIVNHGTALLTPPEGPSAPKSKQNYKP